MKLRHWFFPLLALSLTACASGIKYTAYAPTMPVVPPDTGRIFFYRTAVLGFAVVPDVWLNDKVVGSAKPQGFFFVDRPPGEYQVRTQTEVTRTLSFVLDAGQTRYVRLSIGMGFFVGHVYGELVEPDTALKELQECKYAPPP